MWQSLCLKNVHAECLQLEAKLFAAPGIVNKSHVFSQIVCV